MNRGNLLGLLTGTVLVVSFLAIEAGDARRSGSGSASVSIDGKSFIQPGSNDDTSALRRELAKFGVAVPDDIRIFDGSGPSNPLFSEKLVAAEVPSREKEPRVPEGLKVDHTLRMKGDDGTVELVLGRTGSGNDSAAPRLEADRWSPAQTGGARNLPKILRRDQGKESAIVFLDETQGSFLLLRRLER
jgi:hypothetical protein